MRSSRSDPDPLDPGPAGFTHRGLHYGPEFPENSRIAFATALEFGAGIECDLRLTADDHIVVFHDRDASRLCRSPMKIGESTLADLGCLSLGGHPIPTLGSLLSMVDGRVPLLLEVKVNRDIWRWVRTLREGLSGYEGRLAVMSFDPRIPRLMKTNMPEVRRGLIVRDRHSLLRRRFAILLASPQFLAVERPALGKSWVARARQRNAPGRKRTPTTRPTPSSRRVNLRVTTPTTLVAPPGSKTRWNDASLKTSTTRGSEKSHQLVQIQSTNDAKSGDGATRDAPAPTGFSTTFCRGSRRPTPELSHFSKPRAQARRYKSRMDLTIKRIDDLEFYDGPHKVEGIHFRYAGKELGVRAYAVAAAPSIKITPLDSTTGP